MRHACTRVPPLPLSVGYCCERERKTVGRPQEKAPTWRDNRVHAQEERREEKRGKCHQRKLKVRGRGTRYYTTGRRVAGRTHPSLIHILDTFLGILRDRYGGGRDRPCPMPTAPWRIYIDLQQPALCVCYCVCTRMIPGIKDRIEKRGGHVALASSPRVLCFQGRKAVSGLNRRLYVFPPPRFSVETNPRCD